jgi:hypothetical protein
MLQDSHVVIAGHPEITHVHGSVVSIPQEHRQQR